MATLKHLEPLLIRADANANMGSGHLMRCLALAQEWSAQGGQATFITACQSDGLRQSISDEGFPLVILERSYPDLHDWEMTSHVLATHTNAWMVLDGYHFDSAYQRRVKSAGHRLLVLDDTAHLDHFHADVVLNQNINAEKLHYACGPGTLLLQGTRYVLLRTGFRAWQPRQREEPKSSDKRVAAESGRQYGDERSGQGPKKACNVLVTLGGGDSSNQTLNVIRALQQMNTDELEAIVVVGASHPDLPNLQAAVQVSNVPIQLVYNTTEMPKLMSWADVAVSTGGSTCWELAFIGLPNVVLVLADNQWGIATGLDEAGVALNLGWYTDVSVGQIADALVKLMSNHHLRLQMSQKGQELVDGLGAERVVTCLRKLARH